MRGAYLNPSDYDNRGSSRGGVGDGDGSYEIEIGNNQCASFEMLAFCQLKDEIFQLLGLMARNDGYLAAMILSEFEQLKFNLEERYSAEVRRRREARK